MTDRGMETSLQAKPLPRIGIWPFKRVDWEAIEVAKERRERDQMHDRWMMGQWQKLGTGLSSMSNDDALRCFEELCRGRAWTPEEIEHIVGIARMHGGKSRCLIHAWNWNSIHGPAGARPTATGATRPSADTRSRSNGSNPVDSANGTARASTTTW